MNKHVVKNKVKNTGFLVQQKTSFMLNRIASARTALLLGSALGTLFICLPNAYAEIADEINQSTTSEQSANSNSSVLPVIQLKAENGTVYAGGQVANKSRIGFLGDKDFMDTPFNTVSYTGKYIEDIQAKDVTDVIARTDPSIFSTGASGVIAESYAIRGFTNGNSPSSKDSSMNGLYGIAPFYRTSPEMFERIEVLKGPSGLLNGMPPGGTVGGSVNLVTKRAGEDPLTRFTTTYMSDSQFGGHIDVGRRFGEDKAFGVRFNGMYRDGEGPINDQDKKAQLLSFGLDWRGERARASADLYMSDDRVDGSNRGVNLASGVSLPKVPNPKISLNPTWTFFDTKDKGIMLRGEYDLSKQWMIYAAAGTSKTKYKTQSVGSATITNNAGDISTNAADLKFDYEKESAEIGLRGQFNTGNIGHTLTFNASNYNDKDNEYARRIATIWKTNIYNPDWGTPPNRFDPSMHITQTKSRLSSVGVADTLSMINDQLLLTLGIRHQEVISEAYNPNTGIRTTRYDESANTPAAAILYKLNNKVSAYANYIEGLSKGDVASANYANAGEMFSPYKTKQKELGLKIDLGSFTNTFSVFEIKKPSAYSIPNADPTKLPIYAVNGEQRNRGLEWGFFGTLLRDVRLMGGISYIDPELTKTQNASDQGNMATGVPKTQAKLGIEGDIPAVSGLALTANVSAASKQYLNIQNTVSVPGRTIYGIGARYTTLVAQHPVTIRGNIDNLTNKAYWAMPQISSLMLAAPRTYLLSASFDF